MYFVVELERGDKQKKKGYLEANYGFTKDISKAEVFLSLIITNKRLTLKFLCIVFNIFKFKNGGVFYIY
jgi:hypothetical protein